MLKVNQLYGFNRRRLVVVVGISFVGEADSATTSLTPPTHQTGDLFVAYASSANSTIPTTGTGFTSIEGFNVGGGSGISLRVARKYAASAADTCTGFTNSAGLMLVVLRGVHPSSPVGTPDHDTGTGTTITYPALTLDGSGNSFVLAFGTMRNTGAVNVPTGMTAAGDKQGAMTAYQGPIASFAGTSGTTAASALWIGHTMEIIAA